MNAFLAVGLVSVVLVPLLVASRGRNALDREWIEPGRPAGAGEAWIAAAPRSGKASTVTQAEAAAEALALWPELGTLGDLSDLVGVLAPSDLLWLRDLLNAEGRR